MYWNLQENVIGESETSLLVDFLREGPRLAQSDNVRSFEEAFSAWQGSKYSVYVNSGSSANLLLVSALKELKSWNQDDEIIVPAVTWPTTVTPIIQNGLKPVFVDVNLEDLSFDYETIVISDYDKGFLTEDDIEQICENHHRVFLDTKKVLGPWARAAKFIKINNRKSKKNKIKRSNKLFNKFIQRSKLLF